MLSTETTAATYLVYTMAYWQCMQSPHV